MTLIVFIILAYMRRARAAVKGRLAASKEVIAQRAGSSNVGAHRLQGGNAGGYLLSLDWETGEVRWDERASERRAPKGSVAFADGRLYYRTEEGPMLLIEPSPKEYLERGRFEQPERSDKPAWAHPVIANGKLFIRDQDLLLCYDIKAK